MNHAATTPTGELTLRPASPSIPIAKTSPICTATAPCTGHLPPRRYRNGSAGSRRGGVAHSTNAIALGELLASALKETRDAE